MQAMVISSPLDFHARAVVWGMAAYGCAVRLYDTAAPARGKGDAFELGDAGWTQWLADAQLPMAVWDRRRFPKDHDATVHASDRAFVARESRTFEKNLLALLAEREGIRWIDPLPAIDRAENKLQQLVVARACGLDVPETLVTSDYERIAGFAARHGAVVVKPFQGHLWLDDDKPRFEALAARVPAAALDRRAVEVCPAIYQVPVERRADIRAVLIGDTVYATRYVPMNTADANFDSRVALRDSAVTAEAVVLPAKVRDGLRAMAAAFGITYASADFIEDAAGRFWFLDLNPQGQFLFNEYQVPAFDLLDAMVRHVLGWTRASLGLKVTDFENTPDFKLYRDQMQDAVGNAVQPQGYYASEPAKSAEAAC